jgi:cbb3-type cytochrome oxidase maturation protein
VYYPYFITYMLLGLAISLVVFFWALKNGQFRDQARARFLPLQHEPWQSATQASKLNRYEACALLFLAVAGLVASIAILAFALLSVE